MVKFGPRNLWYISTLFVIESWNVVEKRKYRQSPIQQCLVFHFIFTLQKVRIASWKLAFLTLAKSCEIIKYQNYIKKIYDVKSMAASSVSRSLLFSSAIAIRKLRTVSDVFVTSDSMSRI